VSIDNISLLLGKDDDNNNNDKTNMCHIYYLKCIAKTNFKF